MESAIATMTITQVFVSSLLCLLLGFLVFKILTLAKKQHRAQRSLIDRINSELPQTQCGQCGYEGCRPYARAIAQGEEINRCPPGGSETIIKLANLLNETPSPVNPANGTIKPFSVAYIREDECIGCTKCIKACPVDAIVGGPKLMHTVIVNQCTGCDLCLEPCPVDCIDMVTMPSPANHSWQLPSRIANPLSTLETAQ